MKYTKDEIAEIERVSKDTAAAIMEHFPKDADFEIEMDLESTKSEIGSLKMRIDAAGLEVMEGGLVCNFSKKSTSSHGDATAASRLQETTDLKYKFLKSVLVIGLPSLNARVEKQVKDRIAQHDYIMKIGVSIGIAMQQAGSTTVSPAAAVSRQQVDHYLNLIKEQLTRLAFSSEISPTTRGSIVIHGESTDRTIRIDETVMDTMTNQQTVHEIYYYLDTKETKYFENGKSRPISDLFLSITASEKYKKIYNEINVLLKKEVVIDKDVENFVAGQKPVANEFLKPEMNSFKLTHIE
ncbi:MAG: hypothetical protein IKR58_02565 [Lachnospiraceae bacterium]|nr:hypothetical protein [Lachnospiraceae bacterium]